MPRIGGTTTHLNTHTYTHNGCCPTCFDIVCNNSALGGIESSAVYLYHTKLAAVVRHKARYYRACYIQQFLKLCRVYQRNRTSWYSLLFGSELRHPSHVWSACRKGRGSSGVEHIYSSEVVRIFFTFYFGTLAFSRALLRLGSHDHELRSCLRHANANTEPHANIHA